MYNVFTYMYWYIHGGQAEKVRHTFNIIRDISHAPYKNHSIVYREPPVLD